MKSLRPRRRRSGGGLGRERGGGGSGSDWMAGGAESPSTPRTAGNAASAMAA